MRAHPALYAGLVAEPGTLCARERLWREAWRWDAQVEKHRALVGSCWVPKGFALGEQNANYSGARGAVCPRVPKGFAFRSKLFDLIIVLFVEVHHTTPCWGELPLGLGAPMGSLVCLGASPPGALTVLPLANKNYPAVQRRSLRLQALHRG